MSCAPARTARSTPCLHWVRFASTSSWLLSWRAATVSVESDIAGQCTPKRWGHESSRGALRVSPLKSGMTDQVTDAMQQFGGTGAPDQPTSAGLVLLYADGFAELPAVWSLPAGGNVVLGSGDTADLRLPVPAVSRQHAELCRDRGGWTLRDRNSTNGTYVDGRRVLEARLEHSQELRFGDAIFKFVATGAELYA